MPTAEEDTADSLFPLRGPWAPPDAWAQPMAAEGAPSRWLGYTGSLTHALRARCPDSFHLRLHRRVRLTALPAEAGELGMALNAGLLQREVWLECAGHALVFARSWLPEDRWPDPGDYPLGDLLFEPGSGTERLSLELAPVLGPDGAPHWARRSLYRLGGERLVVGEVFLRDPDEATP